VAVSHRGAGRPLTAQLSRARRGLVWNWVKSSCTSR
jgi:hypothetical protein